ncbi:2'-5' RNA ligase family protein [Alkalicoccobacillus murimartini]|uniref:2'-5' RNA ligase n=1 Tax=Alkalicoccobacillus murimartini TaxID=171685 RepID=A0ABT9YCN1_9BACI|nr:2'-5' RNA ligase family protein [Alkalicoccobacillus murimartini]MDQ0205612.1 2'-5' RNA ligase [Alkalicoccobacillus murimartini]
MTYGIALFPSNELQDEANSYRKRFDSHYASIPPHITLTDSFELDEEALASFLQSLEELANTQPKVVIEVYKADSFIPLYHKIFLKIREHETLTSLHERLHTAPFSSEMTHTFVPHITIAQDLPKAENDDLMGQLKMRGFSHNEVISEFHLIEKKDDEKWVIVRTFELKGE